MMKLRTTFTISLINCVGDRYHQLPEVFQQRPDIRAKVRNDPQWRMVAGHQHWVFCHY